MTNRLHALILSIAAHGVRLGNVLGALGLLALAAALVLALSSCSSGPQTPVTTTPLHISVTINAVDGGMVEDSDVLIDRSAASADPQTTGNDNRGVRVDPQTSVSATGPQ